MSRPEAAGNIGPLAWAAGAACALLLLLTVWLRPGMAILSGVDAACYAGMAAELAAQPWTVARDLHLDGAPFYDHPPGFVWLLGGVFRLLGDSAQVAVQVARAMATGVAVLCVAVAYRLAGYRAAVGACLMLPLLSGFLFESQNPMLEMPLALGLLVATLGALHAGVWGGTLLCVAGFTWAAWMKGPPALAIAPVWLWAAWRREVLPKRMAWMALASLLVCAASFAGYDALRQHAGLPAFVPQYLANQVWPSILVGHHHPVASPWYYVPVLLRWYPLGLVAGVATFFLARHKLFTPGERRLAELGGIWCMTVFLGFSLMRQKYAWYMHPCAAGFAWLGASTVAAGLRRQPVWRRMALGLRGAAAVYAGVALLRPAMLRTPRPALEALYLATPPAFAANEPRVVAYCDGELAWREQHTVNFLWHAQGVGCDVPAPYRFTGGRLVRVPWMSDG